MISVRFRPSRPHIAAGQGLDCECFRLPSLAPPIVGGANQDLPRLCPYAAVGHCYYEENCIYLHGDKCEVCGLQVLDPHSPEQRSMHEKVRLLTCAPDPP